MVAVRGTRGKKGLDSSFEHEYFAAIGEYPRFPRRDELIPENETRLVAAGVVLGRDQDQARASGLRLAGSTEGMKDSDDGSVCGQNPETNRGDDGHEENDGHKKRVHGYRPQKGLLSDAPPRNPYTSFF